MEAIRSLICLPVEVNLHALVRWVTLFFQLWSSSPITHKEICCLSLFSKTLAWWTSRPLMGIPHILYTSNKVTVILPRGRWNELVSKSHIFARVVRRGRSCYMWPKMAKSFNIYHMRMSSSWFIHYHCWTFSKVFVDMCLTLIFTLRSCKQK